MAESLYDQILAHISEEPEVTILNTKLFEDAELVLPQYLAGSPDLVEKRQLLMRHLASDLTDTRRRDHAPVVKLLIKLFDGWTWQQVCDFGTSSIPYKDGLEPSEYMVSFNKLMLCLLSKATTRASDAAHAASSIDTMQALVKLWLCTPDTGIATQAADLLYDLMKVDLPADPQQQLSWRSAGVGAQGLVWKRIFGDRDVYNTFFECCSLNMGLRDLTKSQKTIAQARLMDWLPGVAALNWIAVSRSHHKEVEDRYKFKGGLLDFAAQHMVDHKDDILMHVCLIDFYAKLLGATAKLDTHTMQQHDSVGLQYLIMHGLHPRTAAIYLQVGPVDPLQAMLLYGPAANYLAVYASEYPKHYLASQMPGQVNERLRKTFDLTPGRWAHNESPIHDLHLLSSVPRLALLPFASSPVALLPSKTTNPDVLKTLATVFHGPATRMVVFSAIGTLLSHADQQHDNEEGAAARALYFHYLASNPRFWQDVTKYADTVALVDLALSAIYCLTSLITANWSTKPDLPLPSSIIATSESGILAILSPPALEYTLPYLLKPAQTFTNLVGGRGDSESAAYRIAAAKFEALRTLNSRLMAQAEKTPGEGYEEIFGTIGRKLAEGPMSRVGEVGGSIGTMEL
ncbi:hypothetical protein LTR49_002719 [Elasticomyces elasticus]|nr:hypothetical protein LTR49_002719 [Elasticomyces elasticus]